METGTWIRLGVIAAVSAVSAWILLPTVVSVWDGPAALQEEADKVGDTKTARHRADMRVLLRAESPEAAEAAREALKARLPILGVEADGVEAIDDKVRVTLAPGVGREVIEAASAQVGAVALYPTSTLGWTSTGVAPWAEAWWPEAVAKDGAAVPVGAPVAGTLVSAAIGEPVSLEVNGVAGAAVPNDLVVTVDDAIRGVAHGDGAGKWEFRPTLDASRDAWPKPVLAALAGPSLPTLALVRADEVAVGKDAAGAKPVESRFPLWFRQVLPDTAMSLGLDLRGGIDMTLEVDADETVARELAREAKFVLDQGPKDNLTITSAVPDRARPLLLIESTSSEAEVSQWVLQRLRVKGYALVGREPGAAGATRYEVGLDDDARRKILAQYTEQVLETLRKRIDATGVKEPSIVQKGTGRVGIQLPGLVDLQQAVDAVGTTAVLEFRLYDHDFSDPAMTKLLREAREALPPDQYEDDLVLDDWLHRTGKLGDDRVLRWEYKENADGTRTRETAMPLKAEVILTGTDIQDANTDWDENGQARVAIEFKSRGAQVFCTVTGENVRKRFAILLDDEVRSAPSITERICGGQASITMGGQVDGTQAANTLAVVLRTGSLDAPVSIVALQTVGSTLGKDAIWNGSLAAILGSSLVFLYMVLWYRVSGLVADVTLLINVLVMMASLAAFGATLTLPGICGVALTVGMAVDSNIIIYERIREELRTGVNARKAVEAGFEKAFSSIVDANVSTLIAGVVLYSYGTGPIKGFAVTLNIGILTTLFTALFVSRALMELLTRSSTARLSI